MNPADPEHEDDQHPERSGLRWGAGVIIAAAVIGVAANLLEPGSPLALGLFGVALVALVLFLRSDRENS